MSPVKSAPSVVSEDLSEEAKKKLPHLYGFPWYKWAKEFFDSTNDMNFLCAANQISKSTTMIRKCINWATDKKLWPKLWATTPTQFWYFYPDKETATREFKEKWVKECLPKDKDDPVYGWKPVFGDRRLIHSIEFKSGVTVYFFSYTQLIVNIQSSSVYAMFCDEECPEKVYDEVTPRVWAVDGYFHSVFTATLGLDLWEKTIEHIGTDKEKFPNAFKRQVSMYDCQLYEDGSPSPWTLERIEKRKASCRNEAEVLRRIYGRFILSTNNLFGSYEEKRNSLAKSQADLDWNVFVGTYKDAVVVLKVNPEFNKAEVIDGWLADGNDVVSALDVYMRYRLLTKKFQVAGAFADKKNSKDFITVAQSGGSPFQEVRKPKDHAGKLINSLFQTRILRVLDRVSLSDLKSQIRNATRDNEDLTGLDFVGALIIAVSGIPWNFSDIFNRKKVDKDPAEGLSKRERFYRGLDRPSLETDSYDNEIGEINEEFYEEGTDF